MRNQKGITLVELLAALAIVGIIVVLISSLLSNGTNASQRISLNQQLQQEGNLIVEKIRAQHLLNPKVNLISEQFAIKIENNKLVLTDSTGSIVLSEGYEYEFITSAIDSTPLSGPIILDRTKNSDFCLIIRQKSNGNINYQEYKITTSFSKL